MKLINKVIFSLLFLLFYSVSFAQDYAVVANKNLKDDAEWNQVISFLQNKYDAPVFYYKDAPAELLDSLKKYTPRFVAFVDKANFINASYIMELRRLSRQVDDDVYADYLWGVVTGYDAQAAMQLIQNAEKPLVVKSALSTIAELRSAKWFDRYAWLDDHEEGLCGIKNSKNDSVSVSRFNPTESLQKFYDFYKTYDPDLMVTSGHATERNLEMPFSHGNIKSKNGKLYAAFPEGKEYLVESGKRRVFLGAGNCLMGNVRNNPNSMAIAYITSGNATAMAGYVVTSWYGRAGWGTLKYWLYSKDLTLAEAIFLNEQDMLHQMNAWHDKFNLVNFPYAKSEAHLAGEMKKAKAVIQGGLGIESPTKDHLGFLYDRDVFAYYGDPKAEILLNNQNKDYSVSYKTHGKNCVITIKTSKDFSMNRLKGEGFKQEHVKDLPFSFFFPKRLKKPVLKTEVKGDVLLDEDFILIYNPEFKAGEKYKITLEVE